MATAHTKTPTAGPGPAFAARQRGTGDQGEDHPVPSKNAMQLPPLQIGNLDIDVPVVLAPMAGSTNTALRRLCREYGGGLYAPEMATARALVDRHPEPMRIIDHDDAEVPRAVELYSVDPVYTRKAVRTLGEEDRTDHLDLNMACP